MKTTKWGESRREMVGFTNDVQPTLRTCNRVAILHEGVIRFLGSPAECCEYYGSRDLEQARKEIGRTLDKIL